MTVSRDDVVMQQPEDVRFLVPVFHTPTACAGAATAYPRCATPPCWPTGDFSPITGYFEDAENRDNNDDTYVVPSSTNYNRDRIYIVR